MRVRMLVGWGLTGLLVLGLSTSAGAQAPPPPPPPYPPPPAAALTPPSSPQAAEIAGCLCLSQEMEAQHADMAARRGDYDRLQADLARLDAQLQQERATIDINNPDAVARFRAQLAERDALFQRSTGPAAAALTGATTRYNASIGQYNMQCANHPWDPGELAQVQATLSCPSR